MSIFPTRILLATDGSEDAELAASAAIQLANETGSELHVVYVGDFGLSPHAYPGSRLEQITERIAHRARNLLGERIGLIAAAGGDVSGDHVRVGHPAEEIVALAEELGAGLIVVGSGGLGGVRRALVGSVSDSVVRHAHCPVLVVRGKPAVFPAKILVATDGSEEASLAARIGADLAKSTGSELHVVHVAYLVPLPSYPTEASHAARRRYAEFYEEEQRRAGELLAEQVRKVEDAGAKATEAHLRVGRPDEEIVRLGEELRAGLAIVGSRGLSPMKRTLMGSVSDSVLRHAHCPVLVVRREEKAT